MNPADFTITSLDRVLRTIAGVTHAGRPSPAIGAPEQAMTPEQRRHSAGLMRVNHVGEVCAQALYDAQGRNAKTEVLRTQFALAGKEEEDHLAWTAERLAQLGSHPSLLNPLWYLGAYAFGVLAAKSGDAYSLGFVVETEKQVEAHLDGHLSALPEADAKSRAIVEQMKQDEIEHGAAASDLGAAQLPAPVRFAMKSVAKVMTSAAYYI